MSDRNHILTTPPRWRRLWGFSVLLFAYSILWLDARFEATHPGNIVFLVLCFIAALEAFIPGVHYTISKEGLIIRWLNIPIRKICWDKVGRAEYIHIWKDTRRFYTNLERGPTSGQIIYVTLKGCPYYHPSYEVRAWHNLLHPFRSMCLWLPRETKYEYIDLFKEYFPLLEIQP